MCATKVVPVTVATAVAVAGSVGSVVVPVIRNTHSVQNVWVGFKLIKLFELKGIPTKPFGWMRPWHDMI